VGIYTSLIWDDDGDGDGDVDIDDFDFMSMHFVFDKGNCENW